MADQRQTTTAQLYEQAFPPQDLSYWLGQLLRAPVRGLPTEEDYQRSQGQIGLGGEAQTARQVGQSGLDWLSLLGPLFGLFTTSSVPIRQKEGWTDPKPTWERLRDLWQNPPWQLKAPEPYSGVRVPPIGGASGRGKSLEEIYRYRAPLDMDDDVLDALLKKWQQQQGGTGPMGGTGGFQLPPLPGD